VNLSAIRTLVVVPEPRMARAVSQALAAEGCEVRLHERGGVDAAATAGFDLIVVGAPLSGDDLVRLCRRLRQSADEFAVLALSTSMELLGRVGTALHNVRCGRTPVRTISCSDFQIDFERGGAERGGRPISLTAKELDLLRHLVDHRPTAISRDELLRSVWAYQDGVNTRTVDVHVSSLRQKLERDPRRPKHLRTVRGVGYRFLA
jgi:two-component system alkaline phosphatase synthesis response regulator PhoP